MKIPVRLARSAVSQAVFAVGLLVVLVGGGVSGYYLGLGSAAPAQYVTRTATTTVSSTTTVTASTSMQTLRIGFPPITDALGVYMAIHLGIFQRYGINPVLTQCGGSACIEALQSGQLDIVSSAVSSVVSFAANTGTYLKFISMEKLVGQYGGSAGDTNVLLVRSALKINSTQDLAGKTFLTNALGGANEIVPSYLLEKSGLSAGQVSWKAIGFGDMSTALAATQADVASSAEPFTAYMIQNKIAYPIDNLFGNHSMWVDALGDPALVSAFWTSQANYQKDPGLYQRFVEAVNDGIAYAYALPDVTTQVVSNYTKVTTDVISPILFTTEFFYPTGTSSSPDVANMIQSWVNVMNYTGNLPKPVTVSDFLK